MTRSNVRAGLLAAIVLGVIAATAHDASAQIGPIVTNYSFNVPIVKTVPNPCTGGFVLVNGTMTVAIKTTAATDFTLRLDLASSGLGQDARADGTLVTDGTQKPTYVYSGDAFTETNFPGGTPGYFKQTLNMVDFLKRNSLTPTGDSFQMSANFSVVFSNGIPAAPVLQGISVVCG